MKTGEVSHDSILPPSRSDGTDRFGADSSESEAGIHGKEDAYRNIRSARGTDLDAAVCPRNPPVFARIRPRAPRYSAPFPNGY